MDIFQNLEIHVFANSRVGGGNISPNAQFDRCTVR